mmetsp:Transcript_25811/g.79636  ORF Transcript_25811/g.79636 Transcript_25811/m.79636 type:complete len:228 (-) Transcript_25811:620-1303(-)
MVADGPIVRESDASNVGSGGAPSRAAARRYTSPAVSRRRCMLSRYCCCGPMTHPGRQMRHHAMHSRDVRPKCFIKNTEMSVPVRPRPALQCTATAPFCVSHMSRKARTTVSDGVDPSGNCSSSWRMPTSVKARRSYFFSLSRTTSCTLRWRNGWSTFFGSRPGTPSRGDEKAMNFPGTIQFQSPLVTASKRSYSSGSNVSTSIQPSCIALCSAFATSTTVSWYAAMP